MFFCVYPVLLLILLVLYIFSRRFKPCKRPMKSLSSVVFWNWPISQLDSNFVVIVISSLINIKYGSWEVKEAATNTGLSYALLFFGILYPIFMQIFLYKKRESLKKYHFRKKYGNAYDSLDEEKNRFFLYPLFSYYRRLFVSLSIILLPTAFIVQYFVLTMSSTVMIILIGF